jgi:hypothetical protein
MSKSFHHSYDLFRVCGPNHINKQVETRLIDPPNASASLYVVILNPNAGYRRGQPSIYARSIPMNQHPQPVTGRTPPASR